MIHKIEKYLLLKFKKKNMTYMFVIDTLKNICDK